MPESTTSAVNPVSGTRPMAGNFPIELGLELDLLARVRSFEHHLLIGAYETKQSLSKARGELGLFADSHIHGKGLVVEHLQPKTWLIAGAPLSGLGLRTGKHMSD